MNNDRAPTRFGKMYWLFAAALLWLPGGCDPGGWDVDEQCKAVDQPAGFASQTNLLPIRVLLAETRRVGLNCLGGSYTIALVGGQSELARPAAGSPCLVSRQDGHWQIADQTGRNMLNSSAPSETSLEVRPDKGATLVLGSEKPRRYRGILHLVATSKSSFAVVNIVAMEHYLAGVVGAEMPPTWHKAALRAQSVASRTYALYQMHARKQKPAWDIGNDQRSQVYAGMAAENRRVSEALQETHGVVLAYGKPGREKIFPTYYSSTCGGHTQEAGKVFAEKLPPLQGGRCPYCKAVARPDLYNWPTMTIDKKSAGELLIKRYPALAALGRVVDVKVVHRSDYGRVEKLELLGSNGKKLRLRAEEFRLALSTKENPLRSSWYQLRDGGDDWHFEQGRGWGHGVGMCQCGSQQMAKLGKDCVAILEHYYPRAVLVRAY